ncbi:MAG: 4Fe-4S dicluster domain-containing protein [Candidatus Ranarchaeia archaeon]
MSKTSEKQRIISCDPELCTGCRICEYICALVNEKKINPRLSRIRVIRIDPAFNIAVACRKCENPNCLNSCARNAIYQDPETKTIHINKEKCDGCGLCVQGCNFGAITMSISDRVPLICDTCIENNDGKPACISYCPKEALKFMPLKDLEDESKVFHDIFQKESDKPLIS